MSRERLVLAFGGGKGGVGKSLVCSAVATALAQRGLSVVALDADLGAANLHTLLGLVHPSATLDDFFTGRVARLDEICLPTDIDGLRVISGAAAILRAANPRRRERERLLMAFFELDADVLLLDLGAGTHSNTLDLFNLAGEGLIVTGTEPTAIQNAYAFIKAALFQGLTQVFHGEPEARALVERAVLARGPERIESVERLLSALDERSPAWAERAAAHVASMQIRLVVNQAAPRDARRVLGAIGVVCQRYLGLHVPLLGALPPDATVGRAVHRMTPVMLEDPESPFAQAVHSLVTTLLAEARRTRVDEVVQALALEPEAPLSVEHAVATPTGPAPGEPPDSLGGALRAAGIAQAPRASTPQTDPIVVESTLAAPTRAAEILPEPEVVAEPEPEPEVVAEPEPEPEVLAEPEPEVLAESEPEVVAEPEPEVLAEPEPEPEVLAEPEPEPAPEHEPELDEPAEIDPSPEDGATDPQPRDLPSEAGSSAVVGFEDPAGSDAPLHDERHAADPAIHVAPDDVHPTEAPLAPAVLDGNESFESRDEHEPGAESESVEAPGDPVNSDLEAAPVDVFAALADTDSAPVGEGAHLDDWAASLFSGAVDLAAEPGPEPESDFELDAPTTRFGDREPPPETLSEPAVASDALIEAPAGDVAPTIVDERGVPDASLPFAADENDDWNDVDPLEPSIFVPEAFSETIDGPAPVLGSPQTFKDLEFESGGVSNDPGEAWALELPDTPEAAEIGARPTGSVDGSLRAAGFPPLPEVEEPSFAEAGRPVIPSADADDWLAGFSLDTIDPEPEVARVSWGPHEVASHDAPQDGPAVDADAQPLEAPQPRLPPPESETVRLPADAVTALFGGGSGPEPVAPIVVAPPVETGDDGDDGVFDDAEEWSGWGALADELQVGPEPITAPPDVSTTPGSLAVPSAPPSPPVDPPARLTPPPRMAPPPEAPVPTPGPRLDWPEFAGPPLTREPEAPLPSLPSLPPRAPVPVMRPTLPALPRVRTSAPGASGGRSQPALPGLTPGLAAALAREVAAETVASGDAAWGEDDDPWGSAELASSIREPTTIGPGDPRGERARLGIGFDQAVSSPDGWLQVVTNDLAPLRPALRQVVLQGGKTIHVFEQAYAEATAAAVAQRVEKTHADLVSRLERGGLAAVRSSE
jgi:flagellar biosynthesis protein FlhG